MKNPYERPDTDNNEGTPAETVAEDAGAMRAEIAAETEAAEAPVFDPETLARAEGAVRNELERADASPEDRERGEMVADETREFGGVLSTFSKTKTGRALSRVLAGGMIALSLAALEPAEAGSRGHSKGSVSVGGLAALGAIAGLSVILGGSRASKEAIRAEQRIILEQIRTQRQITIEQIKADKEIRKEEIRKGIMRPESQSRQEQTPNIPPAPPTETQPKPPEPVIDEQ